MTYKLTTRDDNLADKIAKIIMQEGGIVYIEEHEQAEDDQCVSVLVDGVEASIDRTLPYNIQESAKSEGKHPQQYHLDWLQKEYDEAKGISLEDFGKGLVRDEDGDAIRELEEYAELQFGIDMWEIEAGIREQKAKEINDWINQGNSHGDLEFLVEKAINDIDYHHGAEIERNLEAQEGDKFRM